MPIIRLFLKKFKCGSNEVPTRYAFLHSCTRTGVIIYKLRNCQDYDTHDLHIKTATLFIHSGARRYVEQQIHFPWTGTRQRSLSNAASDQSTRPGQKLSAGSLSTMLNNSYLQKAYLESTMVPHTNITEEEYRLCIIWVQRPPVPAETDRLKARDRGGRHAAQDSNGYNPNTNIHESVL